MKRLKTRGFAIATVVLITALLAVIIPFIISLIQQESKTTAKENKNTKSFQLHSANWKAGPLSKPDASSDSATAGESAWLLGKFQFCTKHRGAFGVEFQSNYSKEFGG